MSDGDFKKNFLSDNDSKTNFSKYIKNNKENLKRKIEKVPHPKDYPCSMKDGRLYQKLAVEYIKNILLNGKFNFSENMAFNFSDYLITFTENEHSSLQSKIFLELIAFKDKKAEPQDYMYSGDFDMVIDSISGADIKKSIEKFPMNFYEYQKNYIKDNTQYCIIGEIKKNFFEEIKKEEIQKQFNKYSKIFELLSTNPNLNKLRKRIGLNENNKLIFAVVTDGNFYNFDYLRYLKKKFNEDTHSDNAYSILPKYIEILNLINNIIPVLLIFVPRTLDDNKGIFVSKGERKNIKDLKKKINNLTEEQTKMQIQLDDQKKQIDDQKKQIAEMENKINKLLGKKRKKSIDYEEEDESEENKERKEEKNSSEEESEKLTQPQKKKKNKEKK